MSLSFCNSTSLFYAGFSRNPWWWSAEPRLGITALVNGRMREIVDRLWIDEDGTFDIVLNHNMLVLECNLYGREEKTANTKRRKWRLRDVVWENFQIDLSERNWENERLNGMDEMNDRFVENVKNAAVRKLDRLGEYYCQKACMQAVIEWGDRGCQEREKETE